MSTLSRLACIIGMLITSAAAWADDNSWVSPVSGNWNDATKWSAGHTPVAGENVFIQVAGTYSVIVNDNTALLGNVTIGSADGTQSIVLGPPVPSMWLSSTGVVALNIGARLVAPLDNDSRVILSGPGAELLMNGGSIDMSGGRIIIAGGRFHYISGVIEPPGAPYFLLLQGVELYGNDFTNQVILAFDGGSVVNLNMTNAALLANAVTYNGLFHNLPGGTLNIPRGICTLNSGGLNDGQMILGSSSGQAQLTVRNGPLIVNGTITAAPRFGGVIDGELIINQTGVLERAAGVELPVQLVGEDAHHVIRGTIRGGWEIILSGISPSFTLDGGMMAIDDALWFITGGQFVFLSGSIVGGGSLTMSGVHWTGSPFTNSGNLYLSNGCVIDVAMDNAGFITDPSNGAMPTFNGTFRNLASGLLRIQTGNGGGSYTFNTGLENFGTITTGSSSNGAATLDVSGGPLRNHGTINTADSRGGVRLIQAELINEEDGLLETTQAVQLQLQKTDAHHINRGRIHAYESFAVDISGTGQFENASTGIIRTLRDNTLMTISGNASPTSVPWLTNNGTLETVGASSSFVISVPAGRQFLNDAAGQVLVNGGTFLVSNAGRFHNGGLLCINPGGRLLNTGTVADNYDADTQTWTGGRMKITGPGEVCYPIANGSIHVLETAIGCIHETVTCTSGGAADLFGGLQQVGVSGEFTLDDMSMPTQGDFVVDGTARFVNGAVLTVPGILHSNGTIVIHNSTLLPQSVVIGQGQIVGDGFVGGHIVNNGGRIRPGQSPGRFDATQDYTQGAGGELEIEIGGLTPETEHDVLAVGQTATLGGTLDVLLINGFVPAYCDQFAIVQAAGIVGTFDTASLPVGFHIRYTPTQVRLIYTCPGDFNADCALNSQDFFAFLTAFFGLDASADFNRDGHVNSQDFFDFLGAFFAGC